MKILFDQGTPVPLRDFIHGHLIDTVYERGWSQLRNGELLTIAETESYQVFVSTDQKLKYQQNLSERHISILILTSTAWPRIRGKIYEIQTALDSLSSGEYVEIAV